MRWQKFQSRISQDHIKLKASALIDSTREYVYGISVNWVNYLDEHFGKCAYVSVSVNKDENIDITLRSAC